MHVTGAERDHSLALAGFGCVHRTVGHESRAGELRHDVVAFHHAVHGLGDHLADHLCVQVPLVQDRAHGLFFSARSHDEHPFLRFAQQNLIRRHSLLTHRDFQRVDHDAHVAALGHFGARRREAGCTHVLNRHDVPARDEFERRFEQELLGEGVAHLHARSLGIALVRKVLGRERCAMDSVAPRSRSHRDDRIAYSLGLGADQFILAENPHAHGVHEGIALVCSVEHDVTGDGGNAHAVAVIADSLHDAADEVTNAG